MALIFVLNFLYELGKTLEVSVPIKTKATKSIITHGIITRRNGSMDGWIYFGIVYGAGILFQFAEKNTLSHKDASLVTVFMVLAHAIVEDSFIFMVVGANFWWIFLTRIILAFVVMKLLSIKKHLSKIFMDWFG